MERKAARAQDSQVCVRRPSSSAVDQVNGGSPPPGAVAPQRAHVAGVAGPEGIAVTWRL